MSTPFYEILIRGNTDGTISGSHIIDTPGGSARAILSADWPAVGAQIDAAALATIAANDADKAAAVAAATAAATLAAQQQYLVILETCKALPGIDAIPGFTALVTQAESLTTAGQIAAAQQAKAKADADSAAAAAVIAQLTPQA